MEAQTEKAIVKKAKDGEIVIFWLETKANFGRICCNGVINDGMLWSMSEATYEYFRELKKATKEEIEMAMSAAKSAYNTTIDLRHMLSSKDTKFIWSRS